MSNYSKNLKRKTRRRNRSKSTSRYHQKYPRLVVYRSNKHFESQIINDFDGDRNLLGGLFGSYPIESEYCPFQMPNWGVKFFADSLMQQIDSFNNELLG